MESINITPVNMTSNDQITTLVDVNTNYHIVLTASNDNDPYSEFYPFRAFSDIGFSLGFPNHMDGGKLIIIKIYT